MKKLWYAGIAAFFVFAPFVMSAQIVPCIGGSACQACHIAQLANKIVDFLIVISASIAVILFIYAGFKMVTSAGNTSAISGAKEMFKNVFIGIVIVLCSWLIIDMVMQSLVNPGALEGPWNEIKCNEGQAVLAQGTEPDWKSMTSPSLIVEPGSPGALATGGTWGDVTGGRGAILAPNSQPDLASAAEEALRTKMSSETGPSGGRLACVWAVNQMLIAAGMSEIGNGTQNVYAVQRQFSNSQVDQSSAMRGDIVTVQDPRTGNAHIGVCVTNGCTEVIHNSSGKAAVVNKTPPTMGYPQGSQVKFFKIQ